MNPLVLGAESGGAFYDETLYFSADSSVLGSIAEEEQPTDSKIFMSTSTFPSDTKDVSEVIETEDSNLPAKTSPSLLPGGNGESNDETKRQTSQRLQQIKEGFTRRRDRPLRAFRVPLGTPVQATAPPVVLSVCDPSIDVMPVGTTSTDATLDPSSTVEDAAVARISFRASYLTINSSVAQAQLVRDDKWKWVKCLAVMLGCLLLLDVVVVFVKFIPSDSKSSSESPTLTSSPMDICFDRVPGEGRGEICPPGETQAQGGGVANLVAFSRLTQVRSSDISLLNAGEVRSDIFQGPFTEEDLSNLLPFENELKVIELTGEQIGQVLEEALDHVVEANKTGAYPYAAGLRFSVDFGKNFSSRCTSIEVNLENWRDDASQDVWEPIDAERVYRVLTTSFLAGGGDGYLEMTKVDLGNVRQVFVSSLAAFRNYAVSHTWQTGAMWTDGLLDPVTERYSTQSFHPGSYNFSALHTV